MPDELEPVAAGGTRGRRARVMAVVSLVAVAVVAAVAVPGLVRPGGSSTASVASSGGSATAPATGLVRPLVVTAPCRADDDPMAAEHSGQRLPRTFVPVAGFLCVDDQRTYPGDGTWSVLLGEQVIGGLDAIVSALREPAALLPGPATPEPSSSAVEACPADLMIGPNLVLYDAAGERLAAQIPYNGCGNHPTDAIQAAISGARTTTVQVLKLTQILTEAQTIGGRSAQRAGCPSQWKDEFNLKATPSRLSTGTAINWPAASDAKLCVFADEAKDPGAGDFARVVRLDHAQTQQLLAAAAKPGASAACTSAHHEFVVAIAGTGSIRVEVGGCSRVIRDERGNTSLGSSDPAVIARLLTSATR